MSESPRIGIDLGGTKIEGIVVAGRSDPTEILVRRRIETEADKGYDHIVDAVVGLVRGLAADANLVPPFKVGCGMPGSVTRKGVVKNSNTTVLNGTRFRDDVRSRLGQDVAFANDANCFALAEAVMGAGRGRSTVFGVIMGTGVGGGLAIDGKVKDGLQSICGEWGHMVLRPDSERKCYCGMQGCVETYLAGPWIEKHYVELGGRPCRLPEIIERRESGERIADKCVSYWLKSYGMAMANLINVLDPDVVVLGGGVSMVDCLYGEGYAEVAKRAFTDKLETPIVRNELGDSAGVFGAALLV